MRIDLNCDMGESFGIYRIGADDDPRGGGRVAGRAAHQKEQGGDDEG